MTERSESRKYGPCEAPQHVDNCDNVGRTVDHFTPQCIGKLYGWSEQQINAPENLQMLSIPCHVEKDRDTSLRKDVLVEQMQGADIPFAVHQQIFQVGTIEPLRVWQHFGELMQEGVVYNLPSRKPKKRGRKK